MVLSLKVGVPSLFVLLLNWLLFHPSYDVALGQFVWLTVWYSVTSFGHTMLQLANRVYVGVTRQFGFWHGRVLVFEIGRAHV